MTATAATQPRKIGFIPNKVFSTSRSMPRLDAGLGISRADRRGRRVVSVVGAVIAATAARQNKNKKRKSQFHSISPIRSTKIGVARG
jgi:hypothetical protein